MDELMNLVALENLQAAENQNRANNRRNLRDPFEELSDAQFSDMFRLTKNLVRFVVQCVEPYMRPAVRTSDLDITTKVIFHCDTY